MKIKYDLADYQIIELRRCANIIKNKSTGFESAGFTSPKSALQFLELVQAGHTVTSVTKVGNYYSAQFSNGEEVRALANKSVAPNVYLDLTGQTATVEVKTNEYIVDQSKLVVAKSVDNLIDEVKQLRLWCEKNLSTEFACLLTNVVIAEGETCPWYPPINKVDEAKPIEKQLTDSLKEDLITLMFRSASLVRSMKDLITQAIILTEYSEGLVDWLATNARGTQALDMYINYVDEYIMNPPDTVGDLSVISFDTLLNSFESSPDITPDLIGQWVGYTHKYFPTELTTWVSQYITQ